MQGTGPMSQVPSCPRLVLTHKDGIKWHSHKKQPVAICLGLLNAAMTSQHKGGMGQESITTQQDGIQFYRREQERESKRCRDDIQLQILFFCIQFSSFPQLKYKCLRTVFK